MLGERLHVMGEPGLLAPNAGLRNPNWLRRNGSYESVSQPMHGLDVPWRPSVISQRFAELTHTHRKRGIGDADAGPDRWPEIVLGHQLTGMLHQIAQRSKSFWRQYNCFAPPPQGHIGLVQLKGTEDKHRILSPRRNLAEILQLPCDSAFSHCYR